MRRAKRFGSKKAKGNRLEDEWAEMLKEVDPYVFARRDSGSGKSKEDVTAFRIPLHSECKNQEKWTVHEWWRQTISGCPEGRVPILVIRRNFEEAKVMLRAADFIEILKRAKKGGFVMNPRPDLDKARTTKKRVKLSVSETKNLPFSKFKQLQHHKKKKKKQWR